VTCTPVPEDDASASRSALPTVTEDDMEGPWENKQPLTVGLYYQLIRHYICDTDSK